MKEIKWTGKIPEGDWKYLRTIQPELLETLCAKINRQAEKILQSSSESELEKYRRLYRHLKKSDRIVADCFDDWRRSTIDVKLAHLRKQGLLTDEHLNQMSDAIQDLLERFEQLWKMK